MKYRALALTIAVTLLSVGCNKQEKSQPKTQEASIQNTPVNPEEIKPVAQKLDGLWISNDYISTLEKTKQPYAHTEHASKLFGFSVNETGLTGSNPQLEGFSIYEGGYLYPLEFNAKGYFEIDRKKRNKYPESDLIQLTPLANGKTEITYTKSGKKDVFRKIEASASHDPMAITHAISAAVFAGKYTDKASGKAITFTTDGTVTGFGNYKHYGVLYAFEDIQFDVIYFSENDTTPDTTEYHFVFEGNTVTLYPVINNKAEMDYTFSPEPAFTWIKK
jgi:hypothetical protein